MTPLYKTEKFNVILLSALFAVWYGCFIPTILTSKMVDYSVVGLAVAGLCCSLGLYFMNTITSSKLIMISITLANAGLMGLQMVVVNNWSLVLLGIFQGLLAGIILKPLVLNSDKNKIGAYLSLGLMLPFSTYFIPENETLPWVNYLYIGLGLCFLICILILNLIFPQMKNSTIQNENSKQHSRLSAISIILIIALLTLIEISFFAWAIILKDQSQSFLSQISLPLSLLLIFFLRIKFYQSFPKIENIGWMFVISLGLTFSLGLFFTLGIPFIFAIAFSFSLVFMYKIMDVFGMKSLDYKQIGYLVFIIGIFIALGGFYIQNHIEFIESIKMPANVIHLSAKQAWTKELVSLAGVIVILTGILYLDRRRSLHIN